jgi:hypothetical protein
MIPISNRRRKKQGGMTYLTETALVFLPMIVFTFGLFDFSLVIFLQSMFQSAVRDGARFAITYSTTYTSGSNVITCNPQSACIKQIVQDNSLGFLAGSTGLSYININYYTPDNLSTPLTTAALPHTMPDGTVITFLNQPGNLVEVQLKNFPWNWMVPTPGYMPGLNIKLNAASSDVLQGLPVGQANPPTP